MTVRSTVLEQFRQVAKEQGKKLGVLDDDLVLLDSGLDSLCFAIIVARLEDALRIDPFSTTAEADFPVTLGDFIRFYEAAARSRDLDPVRRQRAGADPLRAQADVAAFEIQRRTVRRRERGERDLEGCHPRARED